MNIYSTSKKLIKNVNNFINVKDYKNSLSISDFILFFLHRLFVQIYVCLL